MIIQIIPTIIIIPPIIFPFDNFSANIIFPVKREKTRGIDSEKTLHMTIGKYRKIKMLTTKTRKNNPYPIIT